MSRLFAWMGRASPTAVLALAAALFLWNLWAWDLWAPDEPYFGEGAREMLVDGEWLVPHVNGEITTDKPPLFFWLIALFSLPVGEVTAMTARLPSLAAGLGSLALMMAFVRRRAGPMAASLSGLMLMSTYLFLRQSRWSQIDSVLCFFVLSSLLAFERFRAGEWSGRKAGILFWGAAALAVLAKGPVGVLLPLGVAIATLVLDREPRRLRELAPVVGPLLFLLLTLAWAIPASFWGDGYSAWGAIREHFFDRGVQGRHHPQPFWYYAKVLPYALAPWSLLLPGALLLSWRRRRQRLDRFLLVWALFVILFFSLSAEKRDLYVLPATPALAILCARLVINVSGLDDSDVSDPGDAKVGMRLSRRWVTVPMGVMASVIVVGTGAVVLSLDEVWQAYTGSPAAPDALGRPAIALGTLAVGLCLLLLGNALRSRPGGAVASGFALTLSLCAFAFTFVYPASNPQKSGRDLAAAVAAAVDSAGASEQPASSPASQQRLFGLDVGNVYRHVNFHAGLYLDRVQNAQQIRPRLPAEESAVVLTDARRMEDLAAAMERRCLTILHEAHLSRRDLYVVRVGSEVADSIDVEPCRAAPTASDHATLRPYPERATTGFGRSARDRCAASLAS